jgi:hypothetical protein
LEIFVVAAVFEEEEEKEEEEEEEEEEFVGGGCWLSVATPFNNKRSNRGTAVAPPPLLLPRPRPFPGLLPLPRTTNGDSSCFLSALASLLLRRLACLLDIVRLDAL